MIDPVGTRDTGAEPEEDWFGEGSSFDSGEELADALFAMAGTFDPTLGAPIADITAPPPMLDGESDFELVHPLGGAGVPAHPPQPEQRLTSPAPQTWSVRPAGSTLVRRSGASGWSIRNSVMALHRIDEVMQRLREDAVTTALTAAAEVFRQSQPVVGRERTPQRAA